MKFTDLKIFDFVFQVSWCDNTTETIHRTYEEMFDFQCKVHVTIPSTLKLVFAITDCEIQLCLVLNNKVS